MAVISNNSSYSFNTVPTKAIEGSSHPSVSIRFSSLDKIQFSGTEKPKNEKKDPKKSIPAWKPVSYTHLTLPTSGEV